MSISRNLALALAIAACIVAVALYGVTVAVLADRSYWALAALLGLLVAAVTFTEPVWGLYLFLVAMFFEGVFSLPTGVTAARMLGIVVLGAWIARSLSSGRLEIALPPPALFAIAYIAWGTMSLAWAIDSQLVLERLQILVQSLALYIMMINLVNTPGRVRTTLALIVVVSVVSAILLDVTALSGQLMEGRADIAQISAYGPNNQAAYLMLGVATLMVWFTQEKQLARKLAFLAAWMTVVLSIVATASRGAMVSLAAVLICGLLLDKKMWQVIVPAPLAGLLALGIYPSLVDRIKSIVTMSDRGAGRLDIWRVGLRVVAAHPLLGVGWGNYGRAYEQYLFDTSGLAMFARRGMGSHNDFLGTLGELGVVGFVLFVGMVGLAFYGALRCVLSYGRDHEGPMRNLAMSVLLGLVGLLVASVFVDLRYRKFFWVVLALSAVVERLRPMPKGVDSG